MKNLYLTLSLIAFSFLNFTVYSQPQLTSQNLADPGDSYTVYTVTNLGSSSDPGPTGANVTWDFSGLSGATSSALDYSSSSDQNYPNANIQFDTQGSTNYFDVSNNAYTYYGFSTSGASSNFTDGQDQARVPMDFNDTYTDAFDGTYDAFGQVFDRSGNLDVTYDSYGTLITPQGTYNNVIRLSIVRTSTDVMNGQTLSNNLDSIYFWYNETTRHPIMTYSINYVDGAEQGRFANYIDDGDVILNTTELEINSKVYPNPAKNKLTVHSAHEITKFSIFDIRGKKILTRTPNNSKFSIDVSPLNKGTYFYSIENSMGDVISRRKLIIQ